MAEEAGRGASGRRRQPAERLGSAAAVAQGSGGSRSLPIEAQICVCSTVKVPRAPGQADIARWLL